MIRIETKSAINSYNPATLEKNETIPKTPLKEFPEIFARARRAQKIWASYSFRQRAGYLYKMRTWIIDNADYITETIRREHGKSRADIMSSEILHAVISATWYARNAGRILKPRRLGMSSIIFANKRNRLYYEPAGVAGLITPWNYPFSLPFAETAMALMAGNAVILKASEYALLSARLIGEAAAAAGLPDGLFHNVVGNGRDVAPKLYENGINRIFFTGSYATGRHVARDCAERLIPVSLELGGKDAMIVLEDADLDRAVNGAVWASFHNTGQVCASVERVYVHDSVYDEFLARASEAVRKLRHGMDSAADIGPLMNEQQYNKVQGQLEDALRRGAKVAASSEFTGGSGWFVPATILTGVTAKMKLMEEETFGPFMPVIRYRDAGEIPALVNQSRYGLTASIWTRNHKKAVRLAQEIEAGVISVNDHLYIHINPEVPWGGVKDSGMGRTHSSEGLYKMTEPKVINYDLLPVKRNAWWYPADSRTYDGILAVIRLLYLPLFARGKFRNLSALLSLAVKMLRR